MFVLGDEVIDGGADAVQARGIEFLEGEGEGFGAAFALDAGEGAVGTEEVAAAEAPGKQGAEILAVEEGAGVGEVAVEGRVVLPEVAVDSFDDAEPHGGGDAEFLECGAGGGVAHAGIEGKDVDIVGEGNGADEAVGLRGVSEEGGLSRM